MGNESLVSAVKRVSIFCRDLDRSLAFYRDLLRMKVIEDKTISGAAVGKLVNLPACTMRIVYLQADPRFDAGLVGLFAVLDQKLPDAPRLERGQIHAGQMSFVFGTEHGDEIHTALVKSGARFLTPPMPYTKAKDDAYMKAGIYTEMIVYDPDGHMVSILGYKPTA